MIRQHFMPSSVSVLSSRFWSTNFLTCTFCKRARVNGTVNNSTAVQLCFRDVGLCTNWCLVVFFSFFLSFLFTFPTIGPLFNITGSCVDLPVHA